MHTPGDALAFLAAEHATGATGWSDACERLQRTAYGLPAMYSSANLHHHAIPPKFRHGHEQPAAGDLALMRNATHGHIVTCTGEGWSAWTNDYTGRGRVGIADVRALVDWCHADDWYIADAWWGPTAYQLTHLGDDMPLTGAELDAIADRVWAHALTEAWDGKPHSAESILASTHFYAVQGGADTVTPATATTGAGTPTLARRLLSSLPDPDPGPVPAPGVGLSDADVARIAAAVGDVLAARLVT